MTSERAATGSPTVPRPSFYGITAPELSERVGAWGGSTDNARRIYTGVFARGLAPEAVDGVAGHIRRAVADFYDFTVPVPAQAQISSDGTRKLLFAAPDGAVYETVYIPAVARGAGTNTLCVSSQTGCAVGCTFCFTASIKRQRDLSAAEIVAQVVAAQANVRELGQAGRITNIVFMGMGEPLLNYDHVVQAVRVLLHHEGLDFSRRKVTISTAGVVPRIAQLGRDVGTLLAVSLNATTDEVRDRIMPINRKWPIAQLLEAMRTYPKPRGGRVTVEYVLLGGLNDSSDDARRLVELLRCIPVKLNLLPLNPHDRTPHEAPSTERVAAFQEILWAAGHSAIVRKPRGQEITAACGQLGGAVELPAPPPPTA